MVAITEPATMIDGIRSLKRSRKIRTFNPGPMPNRLGGMQSTTPEPSGKVPVLGFEFWVGPEACITNRANLSQNTKLKTQNSRSSLPTPIVKNVVIGRFANPFEDFEPGFKLWKVSISLVFFLNDGHVNCFTET